MVGWDEMDKSNIIQASDHFRVGSHAQDRLKLPKVFWAGLKAIGLSPGAILRLSHLPPTVYSGETFITTADNFAIWRSIGELAKDPTMGWKFMREVDTDQYHPTLLAALHARTYRESIGRLARYKRLCSAEEFRTTVKEDEVLVEVLWPFAPEASPPLMPRPILSCCCVGWVGAIASPRPTPGASSMRLLGSTSSLLVPGWVPNRRSSWPACSAR